MTEQLVENRTIDLALPPIHAEIGHVSQTPVENDGSFFELRDVSRITPVDELTNIPLPIVPAAGMLPRHKGQEADWHHAFHPREHPLLQTTAGLAIRHSRVQLVDRAQHNESATRYHKFFDGPPLPTTDEARFNLVVYATAGHIPDQAIDTRSGTPEIIELNDKQRSLLRIPRVNLTLPPNKNPKPSNNGPNPFEYWHVRYSFDATRAFFGEYMLGRTLEHLPEETAEKFLYSRDEEARYECGIDILREQIEPACEAVSDTYSQLHMAGSLHPIVPDSAKQFVYDKLGGTTHRRAFIGRLFGAVALTYGATGLTIRGERAII